MAELITDLAGAEALAAEWDALAVAASKPAAAPAWVLAWWRHVATNGLRPRLVAVHDRGTLIGVAPFHAISARWGTVVYRLMGGGFGMTMEPLAPAGRKWEVAAEIARALDAAEPRPDVLEFGPMAFHSPWTNALRSGWPSRTRGLMRRYRVASEPAIALRAPTFEGWWASLGTKTRRSLRREERLFARAGGTTRWSTASTLRADVEAFARLHNARWAGRGASRLAALGPHLPDWLEALGRDLVSQGRFRMCLLEVEGAPICASLYLVAGEEYAGVNLGWDERYRRLAPGKLATLRAVEDFYRAQCRRLGLGAGDYAYKQIFANSEDPVAWEMMMTPSLRLPQTYGSALPDLAREHTRELAERLLPAQGFEALRSLGARAPRGGTRRPVTAAAPSSKHEGSQISARRGRARVPRIR